MQFSRTKKRVAALMIGLAAATAVGGAVAAPAHAQPQWGDHWNDEQEWHSGDKVYYEDGRPFVVNMCWSYEWGYLPCGRYL